MAKRDFYQVLGVKRDASEEEIRKAYRNLARKFHPDVNKAAGSEDRFKEIGEAYSVLNDSKKRAAYDKYGEMWKHAEELDAAAESRSGPNAHYTHMEDLGSLFEELFRTRGPRGYSSPSRGSGVFPIPGMDQHAKIDISLEEAFHGASRTLRFTYPESQPDGQGRPRSEEIKVKIPPGVTNGQILRLAGKGGPGSGNAPSGDLYIELRITPHKLFEVDGKDIYLSLPISPWEAALGATISVPVLAGKVEMKIPAGAQAGGKLRLKGKGLPGSPAGDQYVVLKIVTPKAKSQKQREFYRDMAEEFNYDPRAELGV
ncbi:MAG: DnaJ domain-containing protein [Deltaproteobacteria bacterium]|nr:DnaJ domain-containing protein [Deltaproteobacteria bacterium]